jgi:hypothetical protein
MVMVAALGAWPRQAGAEDETPPDAEASAAQGPSPRDIAGYVTLALGGATLAGGGAAAIFALHKRIQLEQVCQPRDDCPVATAPDIEQMQTMAHVATALSLAGFVGVGVGAGLLLWPEDGQAQARITPGGIELRLRF